MKLLIVDSHQSKASDAYSETEGMGGIISSLLYLSDSLAAEGHEVNLGILSEPTRRKSGVTVLDCTCIPTSFLSDIDAVIVSNNALNLPMVKQIVAPHVPVFLWVHIQHNVMFHDLGCLAHYLDTDYALLADGIVFVSEWQKQIFLREFPNTIPAERCCVIRNACNPFVLRGPASLTDATDTLFTRKRAALEVAYVSAPTRGLDTLLEIWPTVRAACPNVRLAVYSGQSIYGVRKEADQYGWLSDGMPDGAEYRGPLSHANLAERLFDTAIVAYPTAFEETSGIAPIEALAAGCSLICSDRGALPESTAGFATMLRYDDANLPAFKDAFTAALIAKIRQWESGDPALKNRMHRQRAAFTANYQWKNRALEWMSLIAMQQNLS